MLDRFFVVNISIMYFIGPNLGCDHALQRLLCDLLGSRVFSWIYKSERAWVIQCGRHQSRHTFQFWRHGNARQKTRQAATILDNLARVLAGCLFYACSPSLQSMRCLPRALYPGFPRPRSPCRPMWSRLLQNVSRSDVSPCYPFFVFSLYCH